MQELHKAVRRVLFFYPRVVRNYGSAVSDESKNNVVTPSDMIEAAEFLVTQLIVVLSRGLDKDVDLWTVLETLEHIPQKIFCEGANSPAKEFFTRLKFSGQLIYVIKSTFASSPAPARTRALVRLALNQGLLLAALELIAKWNGAELAGFYTDPAASVLCSVDGHLWDAFLRACAPIAGVTLADIAAGVTKGASAVKFDMKLEIPDATNECGNGLTPSTEQRGVNVNSSSSNNSNGDVVLVERIPLNSRADAKRKHTRIRRKKNKGSDSSKNVLLEVPGERKEKEAATTCFEVVRYFSSEAEIVERLLNQAELLLLERWNRLSTDMAAQEGLLLEKEDNQ